MSRPRSPGHREMPHTADVRIEAWAGDRERCLTEAVAALVESFAERPAAGGPRDRSVTVDVPDSDDADTLVSVLDTVIYLMETRGGIPGSTDIECREGELRLHVRLVDLETVEIIGAVPKAVTLHDLRFRRDETGWCCAATIDV